MPALVDAPTAPEAALRQTAAPPLRVAALTLCYPSRRRPWQGVFVQRRLAALSRIADVRVIAPRPWFPILRPADSATDDAGPAVLDAPMFYLPGALKRLDAAWFARAAERGLRSLLRDRPIDVVDTHFEWPDGVGGWRAARRLGLPVVVTLRGKLAGAARHSAMRRRLIAMLRDADGLIAVSRDLADQARSLAGISREIAVIPNGVDATIFFPIGRDAARAELGWPDAERWLVAVGHLQALKGWDLLIAALPAVRQRLGDVRLALVGGGAGEARFERLLRRQVESLGLHGAVLLAGPQPADRVNLALSAADLFVLPSRSEGCCNALLEAQAAGCPAVVTDAGDSRAIIGDATFGLCVERGDSAGLAAAIIAALERTWDRAAIARRGAARSWRSTADRAFAVLSAAAGAR